MTVLDGATATAIARRQRPSRDGNGDGWRNKHNNQLIVGA
jgi:hypothetical protein